MMLSRVVDLRSDTVTKPTAAMRRAMAEALVGDDVYREDPTVLELEAKVAGFLGKEAALFVPTGTMGNLASIMAHCWTRGQEILVGDQSHIFMYEQGGVSQIAGVHSRAVITKPDGTFDLEELKHKIRLPGNDHEPFTGLICLENTHNICGGIALPMEYIAEVCRLAKDHDVPVHMDGARIVNASTYLKISAKDIVRDCDSVSMCLSKGLGAPVGSVVAGKKNFIQKVLRCRKVLGGGMRQVGVLAAAGIVALDTMVDRIQEDHRHAQMLRQAISDLGMDGVVAEVPSEMMTNMVLLNLSEFALDANTFLQRLMTVSERERLEFAEGVQVKASKRVNGRIRLVFHADVTSDDAQAAIRKMIYVLQELKTA